MALNLTSYASMLKEDWIPYVNKAFNDSSILLKRLQRKTWPAAGEYQVIPIISKPNEAVGSRYDGGSLPTPSQQTYSQAKFYRSHSYARFKITGPTLSSSRGKGSPKNALQMEMMGIKDALARDVNRQLHGTGSALLATIGATATSTTQTLRTTATYDQLFKYIRSSVPVDVKTKSTLADVAGGADLTISSINETNNTVVLSGSVTGTADLSGIYRAGNFWTDGANEQSADAYGLRAMLSTLNPGVTTSGVGGDGHTSGDIGVDPDGLYGGIDRSTAGNEFWHANVLGNAGTLRPLTMDLVQQALDKAETVGKGNISMILCDQEMWRTFGMEIIGNGSQRVFNDKIVTLDGGFKAVEFQGILVVKDKDAWRYGFSFIDESSLYLIIEESIGILDEDGLEMRYVTDEDALVGTAFTRFQLGCSAPNKNTLLTDISPVVTV